MSYMFQESYPIIKATSLEQAEKITCLPRVRKEHAALSMILALLTGITISIMISVNGHLTAYAGPYLSAVFIHIVGTAFASLLCIWKKQPVLRNHGVPGWTYLGGVIGVLTTLFNNFAFSRISMTSIVALGLLGQSLTSALIDSLGLLGMKKHRLQKSAFIGIAISCTGVAVMLDASIADQAAAVLVSVGAGICVVLSRTVNARLSDKAGAFAGSFYNHLAGLPCCLALWLLFPDAPGRLLAKPAPWIFCGGMFGVMVVFLYNITVPRISAFRLTLLAFLGQMFTGITLDLLSRKDLSKGMLWGSVLCALGFLASVLMELPSKQNQAKKAVPVNHTDTSGS